MDEDDDAFLRSLNKKRKDASTHCSELEFEQVMNGFESAANEKQPYAAVDGTPVLSYDELVTSLEEWVEDDRARKFARDIYQHWRARRLKSGNKPLVIILKVNHPAPTSPRKSSATNIDVGRDWSRYR